MNVETVVKLIVICCEAIQERAGGRDLEARVANRVLAELSAELPAGRTRPQAPAL